MKLANGTILPSGLLGSGEGRESVAFNRTYKNTALRAGIVVKRYEPDDNQNVSKLAPEYDVLVIEQDENMGTNISRYKNCIASDSLGSIADHFEKKFRVQEKFDKTNDGKDFKGQDGAVVLILCLDSVSEKGIIIGGLHHPDRTSKLSKDTFLMGEYNGIKILIRDDGSFNMTFRGATDNKGKPKDSTQGDTTFDIEKDGSVQFKNKGVTMRAEKGGKFLLTTEDSTTVTAKKEILMTTEDQMTAKAKANMTFETMAELLVKATGSATMSAASLNIQTEGEGVVKCSQINLEASSMLKAKASNIVLDGFVNLGSAGGTPALILQTQFLGIGNLGAPVISQAIGPFSTKVTIV